LNAEAGDRGSVRKRMSKCTVKRWFKLTDLDRIQRLYPKHSRRTINLAEIPAVFIEPKFFRAGWAGEGGGRGGGTASEGARLALIAS
jgi:hypothetical protein